MKAELVENSIPDSLIYLDYAGFRTLDAVVRAKEIFGQNSFIVISLFSLDDFEQKEQLKLHKLVISM